MFITYSLQLIETDISGRCETTYEPLESNQDVTIIRKSKNLNKCKLVPFVPTDH